MRGVVGIFSGGRAVLAALALGCVVATGASAAQPAAKAAFTPKQQITISRIETYLTNMRTMTADFSQVADDGALTSGKMFIKRPNKMRWVYDAPTPILMVTRGNFLTYYDFDLQQVSDIPLDSTLLGFFASDRIKFGETVKVVGLQERAGAVRIRLQQADDPSIGTLTMEFSDTPLVLRSFVIKDAQGKSTSVALNNTRFDEPLNDDLFTFADPRIKGRRTKRSGTE